MCRAAGYPHNIGITCIKHIACLAGVYKSIALIGSKKFRVGCITCSEAVVYRTAEFMPFVKAFCIHKLKLLADFIIPVCKGIACTPGIDAGCATFKVQCPFFAG